MATDTDARVVNASLDLETVAKNMEIIHDFAIRRLDPPPSPPTYPSNGTFFHLI